MRILALILGSVTAYLLLRYRRPIKEFTGDMAIAEKIFGAGGTNTFIVVFALLVFIGSLMYAAGTLDAIIQGTVGRFFF